MGKNRTKAHIEKLEDTRKNQPKQVVTSPSTEFLSSSARAFNFEKYPYATMLCFWALILAATKAEEVRHKTQTSHSSSKGTSSATQTVSSNGHSANNSALPSFLENPYGDNPQPINPPHSNTDCHYLHGRTSVQEDKAKNKKIFREELCIRKMNPPNPRNRAKAVNDVMAALKANKDIEDITFSWKAADRVSIHKEAIARLVQEGIIIPHTFAEDSNTGFDENAPLALPHKLDVLEKRQIDEDELAFREYMNNKDHTGEISDYDKFIKTLHAAGSFAPSREIYNTYTKEYLAMILATVEGRLDIVKSYYKNFSKAQRGVDYDDFHEISLKLAIISNKIDIVKFYFDNNIITQTNELILRCHKRAVETKHEEIAKYLEQKIEKSVSAFNHLSNINVKTFLMFFGTAATLYLTYRFIAQQSNKKFQLKKQILDNQQKTLREFLANFCTIFSSNLTGKLLTINFKIKSPENLLTSIHKHLKNIASITQITVSDHELLGLIKNTLEKSGYTVFDFTLEKITLELKPDIKDIELSFPVKELTDLILDSPEYKAKKSEEQKRKQEAEKISLLNSYETCKNNLNEFEKSFAIGHEITIAAAKSRLNDENNIVKKFATEIIKIEERITNSRNDDIKKLQNLLEQVHNTLKSEKQSDCSDKIAEFNKSLNESKKSLADGLNRLDSACSAFNTACDKNLREQSRASSTLLPTISSSKPPKKQEKHTFFSNTLPTINTTEKPDISPPPLSIPKSSTQFFLPVTSTTSTAPVVATTVVVKPSPDIKPQEWDKFIKEYANRIKSQVRSINAYDFADATQRAIFSYSLSYNMLRGFHCVWMKCENDLPEARLMRHLLAHLPTKARPDELLSMATEICSATNFDISNIKESDIYKSLKSKWDIHTHEKVSSEECVGQILLLLQSLKDISHENLKEDKARRDAVKMILAIIGDYVKILTENHGSTLAKIYSNKECKILDEAYTLRNLVYHNFDTYGNDISTERVINLAKDLLASPVLKTLENLPSKHTTSQRPQPG